MTIKIKYFCIFSKNHINRVKMLNYMTFRIKNSSCFVIKKGKMTQISYKMRKSMNLYDKQHRKEYLLPQNVI